VGKDEWRADSETGEAIPEGKLVAVARVEGTHLVVKVVKEGE
jgi:membrane protein implicated in regulation of membrane protease activity